MTGRVFELSHRPATLRQWSEESMHGALKAVRDGILDVTERLWSLVFPGLC